MAGVPDLPIDTFGASAIRVRLDRAEQGLAAATWIAKKQSGMDRNCQFADVSAQEAIRKAG
jgi:hypothetical protein